MGVFSRKKAGVASFTLGKTSVHMLVMRGISWPSLVLRRILGLCSFSLMLRGERMAQRHTLQGRAVGKRRSPHSISVRGTLLLGKKVEGTGCRVCVRLWGRSTGPVRPLRHDSLSLLGVLTPEPVTGNVCKCWMGSFVTRSLGSGRVSLAEVYLECSFLRRALPVDLARHLWWKVRKQTIQSNLKTRGLLCLL